ncbi:MAG: hypothetical protein HFH75_10880 [Lachnospiraceae bacterium]|nr:hypothetical protein [Lachnospiraceae bacterium]
MVTSTVFWETSRMRSAASAMALSSCCISCARLPCRVPWAIRSTDRVSHRCSLQYR